MDLSAVAFNGIYLVGRLARRSNPVYMAVRTQKADHEVDRQMTAPLLQGIDLIDNHTFKPFLTISMALDTGSSTSS